MSDQYKGVGVLTIDLLAIPPGDLMYTANFLAQLARDKQAVIDAENKPKEEPAIPTEPEKTTETVQ